MWTVRPGVKLEESVQDKLVVASLRSPLADACHCPPVAPGCVTAHAPGAVTVPKGLAPGSQNDPHVGKLAGINDAHKYVVLAGLWSAEYLIGPNKEWYHLYLNVNSLHQKQELKAAK